MSKLTDQLRAHGISNSWDFAHARGMLNREHPIDRPVPRCRIYAENRLVPMVTYIPADRGRSYKPACWSVSQGHVKVDPSAHYRDNGHKAFDLYTRDEKQPQFSAALAWASDYFGVEEWAREPFGSWMPAEFVDARLKQLKDWMRELEDASDMCSCDSPDDCRDDGLCNYCLKEHRA